MCHVQDQHCLFAPMQAQAGCSFFRLGMGLQAGRAGEGQPDADRDFCLIFCLSHAWAAWTLRLHSIGRAQLVPKAGRTSGFPMAFPCAALSLQDTERTTRTQSSCRDEKRAVKFSTLVYVVFLAMTTDWRMRLLPFQPHWLN